MANAGTLFDFKFTIPFELSSDDREFILENVRSVVEDCLISIVFEQNGKHSKDKFLSVSILREV